MAILVFLLSVVLALTGVAIYSMKLRHQLQLRELELKTGGASAEAIASPSMVAEEPEIRAVEPVEVAPPDALPAYVDPEDPASMAAWREAQQELDKAW